MPKLARSDWYALSRDTNWTFRYVTEEEVFPEELSGTHRVSSEGWLAWDEPYKVSYREYVHNQVTKDTRTYSVKNAIARSKLFDNLDPGWKSAILAHYGAITMPEYLASLGEARMGRFGRAAAWRNTATFGTRSWSPHKHNDGAAAGDASCEARPVPHPTPAPTPRPAPAHWTGRLGNPGTRLAARPARCGVDGGDQPRDVVSLYPGNTTTDIPSTFEGDHLMPRASLTTSAGGWEKVAPEALGGAVPTGCPERPRARSVVGQSSDRSDVEKCRQKCRSSDSVPPFNSAARLSCITCWR
jgi:Methane/Phenol/Toluene Hydroxylase